MVREGIKGASTLSQGSPALPRASQWDPLSALWTGVLGHSWGASQSAPAEIWGTLENLQYSQLTRSRLWAIQQAMLMHSRVRTRRVRLVGSFATTQVKARRRAR